MTAKPPGFIHTPYGSFKPFTIGMSLLDLQDWIEADEHLPRYLTEKERLIIEDKDQVFREEPDTREAQAEVLTLLSEHLLARFPDIYRRDGPAMEIVPHRRKIGLDSLDAPLLTAARLVQEDLVLMRRGEDGWRFAAGAVAFPSSWSLDTKFGKTLDGLHIPVPGYDEFLAGRVARIFDNLKADQPVQRFGWSFYADDDLAHPAPRPRPEGWPGEGLGVFVRLERQTLRRLPVSGDILFTIRIHIDPLAVLKEHPEGARLAAAMLGDLEGLNEPQLRYRSLLDSRDAIVAELRAIAGR